MTADELRKWLDETEKLMLRWLPGITRPEDASSFTALRAMLEEWGECAKNANRLEAEVRRLTPIEYDYCNLRTEVAVLRAERDRMEARVKELAEVADLLADDFCDCDTGPGIECKHDKAFAAIAGKEEA
jgi:hypothetical protein